jgi:hypothetical protein
MQMKREMSNNHSIHPMIEPLKRGSPNLNAGNILFGEHMLNGWL